MDYRPLSSGCMRLVAHGMDTAGVDPPIVEVEQRANRDGVVYGLVTVTGRMQALNVVRLNIVGITIHLLNKPHQSLFRFG